MPRFVVPVLVFAVAGLVLSVYGLMRVSSSTGRASERPVPEARPASAQDEIAHGLAIPQFALTDQAGNPATHAILEGKLTVVAFMFTNCPFACPMITASMHDVADKLAGTPVRFLSISVDPTHDTPERLREYAARNAIDLSRWTLVTGEQAKIDAIAKGALGFALQPDPARQIPLGDGTSMANIVHPTKLLLVGPDRNVLGFFESAIPMDVDALARRARAAATELKLTP